MVHWLASSKQQIRITSRFVCQVPVPLPDDVLPLAEPRARWLSVARSGAMLTALAAIAAIIATLAELSRIRSPPAVTFRGL
jgi:hypothetical protein